MRATVMSRPPQNQIWNMPGKLDAARVRGKKKNGFPTERQPPTTMKPNTPKILTDVALATLQDKARLAGGAAGGTRLDVGGSAVAASVRAGAEHVGWARRDAEGGRVKSHLGTVGKSVGVAEARVLLRRWA